MMKKHAENQTREKTMIAKPADCCSWPPVKGFALALMLAIIGALLLTNNSCNTRSSPLSREERIAMARQAITQLQAGNFEEAENEAQTVLSKDAQNSQANLVMAIAQYHKTIHEFRQVLTTNKWIQFSSHPFIDHKTMRLSLKKIDEGLEKVEQHLAVGALDRDVFLELSLASWERDWNHNGQVDRSDRLLFQIELDAHGNQIPEDDPRRKPTFRFDTGDVYWARAMIAFQRSLVNLILAYRWTELDKMINYQPDQIITIHLNDHKRIRKMRDLILSGIAHADKARREYLAEKDDQGEWVPNPRQKNHPLPLPVDETLYQTWEGILDDTLYQTWEGILDDMRRMLEGKEGISVVEIAQLGDHKWDNPPRGYIDIQKLTTGPGDIVLDFAHLADLSFRSQDGRTRSDVESVLTDIFGDKYVKEMKPSPLINRLIRMKREIERGEESLERKLRYLLWLN
ncbi:MAG: hypothetical protein GY751_02740 [Bacteroidetes bacterium]|nr:hypothetical protein [Bacteroidota bacterium]